MVLPREVPFLLIVLLCLTGCSSSAGEYLARGKQFFDASNFPEAAINYTKAIQKDPAFGEAHYRLGLTRLKQNRAREAYQSLVRANQLMPADEQVMIDLADLTIQLYIADPQHPSVLYDQAHRLAGTLLTRDVRSVASLKLNGILARLDRRPDEAINYFLEAKRTAPEIPPDLDFNLAMALFESGQASEGERVLTDLTAKQQDYGPAYDSLYRLYLSGKRVADAERILLQKVEANPANAAYLLQLAAHHVRFENHQKLQQTLARLVSDPQSFPRGRLQAGDFYVRLGRFRDATEQYELGAEQDPENRSLYRKRIVAALAVRNQAVEALNLVESIIRENPADADARAMRAGLWLRSSTPDEYARALPEFLELIKQDQKNAKFRFGAGQAYLRKGQLDQARKELQEAIRLDPGYIGPRYLLAHMALQRQDSKEALLYANQLLTLAPHITQVRLLRSAAWILAGQHAEARTELARIVQENPSRPEARLQMGYLAIAQGEDVEAERIFLDLKNSHPDDLRSLMGLTQLYTSQREFQRVREILQAGLAKNPDSVGLRQLLAGTAAQMGSYDLAIQQYEQILAIHPGSLDALLRMGELHRQKGEFDTALTIFEKAHQLDASQPLPIIRMADALDSAGRTAESVPLYRRALALRPEDPILMNNLAYLLARKGSNLDEALELAQKAAQKSPSEPKIVDTLGFVYLKKGLTASALQTFQNLIRQYPNNPTFRLHLAMTLLEKGERPEAKEHLLAALAHEPAPAEEQSIRNLLGRLE